MPDFIDDEPSEAETPAEMAAQRAALDAKRDARKPAILAAVALVQGIAMNADTQACLDAVVAWCRGEGTMQAVVSGLVATERLWSTEADSVQIAAQAAREVANMVLDDDGDLAEATACVRDDVARAVAAAHVEAGHPALSAELRWESSGWTWSITWPSDVTAGRVHTDLGEEAALEDLLWDAAAVRALSPAGRSEAAGRAFGWTA